MENTDDIAQEPAEPADVAEDTTVFVAEADAPSAEDAAAAAFDAPALAADPAEAPVDSTEPEPEPAQQSLDEMVDSLRGEDGAEPDEAPGQSIEAAAAPIEPAGDDAAPVATIDGEARTHLLGRVPFYVIAGLWPVFSGVMTYLLWPLSAGAFVDGPLYAGFVWGGVALVLVGFATAAIVFAVLRARSEPGRREGLTRAVLLRASVVTTIGVVCWWAGLLALDLHRVGRLG